MALRMNPGERFTLNNLARSLAVGLDPTFAYGVLGNTISGAQDRNQTQRQTVLGLQDLAMQQASAGVPQPQASAYLSSIESQYPFLSRPNEFAQNARESIDSALSGLYPGQGVSPVYTAPIAAQQALQSMPDAQAAPLMLDPADFSAIENEVKTAATQTGSTEGLHEVRMRVMTRLRAMGVDPAQQRRVFDFIEAVWKDAGGPLPPGFDAGVGTPGASTPSAGVPDERQSRMSAAFDETGLGVFGALGRWLTG